MNNKILIINTDVIDYLYFNDQNIEFILVKENVKYIGKYAFANCLNIKRIKILSNNITIGDGAFSRCHSLTIVIFNKNTSIKEFSNNLFFRCKKLQKINIPKTCKKIGIGCFEGCSSLLKIIIPNSIKIIGNNAFSQCYLLNTVELSKNVLFIDYATFENCYNLQNINFENKELIEFEHRSFYNCNKLINKKFIASKNLYALYDCKNDNDLLSKYHKLDISNNSNTQIHKNIININDSYLKMQSYVGNCNITDVILQENILSIDEYTFYNCFNIQNIIINNTNITIFPNFMCYNNISLKTINLPNLLKIIGEFCFHKCLLLNNIKFNTLLKILKRCCFLGCETISEINIKNTLITEIPRRCFHRCLNLKTIYLPINLTYVDEHALSECFNLKTVFLNKKTVFNNSFDKNQLSKIKFIYY